MEQFVNDFKNINSETSFLYVCIAIIILAFFIKVEIKLNIILGLIIIVIIIIYLNTIKKMDGEQSDKQYEIKYNEIIPKSKIIRKYNEIIDFLFSVQDFYIYNPPTYENLIDLIDDFFLLYEEAELDNSLSGKNFILCEQKKSDIVNTLHSMIFTLPSTYDNVFTIKLNNAIIKLNSILDNYLDKLFDSNKNVINKNGINNNTIFLNNGPKSSNYYNKDKYSYDFF